MISWSCRAFAISILLAVAAAVSPISAQLSPNKDWRSLRTRHFYVHFTPGLEALARRAAASAETAYVQLASELVPPRGPIDLVISDDVDFSNGFATPFPTNRITIYANPPIQESALRFTDDWAAMVITHELTHVFHLDRSRGIWALGQHVFGRAPYLFPNVYAPSWLTEGLAVYYESRFTGAGRITGTEHRMIARASAIDHAFPALNQVSLGSSVFPFGEAAYAYGSLFVDYLARRRGETHVRDLVEKSSAQLIPFWLNRPASQAFGISFSKAYAEWRDSVRTSVSGGAASPPLPEWRDLTRDGVYVSFPRWLGDNALIYSGTPGRESYGAYQVSLDGKRRRVGRRNSESPQVRLADGSLLFAQLDYTNPYQIRSDLFVQRGRRQRRVTTSARVSQPDANLRGIIVAVNTVPGGTRLVLVSLNDHTVRPITGGGYDEQWTEPRWSHRGDRIAAVRWLRGGASQIVVLDATGSVLRVVASGHAVFATPSWSSDDAQLFYTSDRTGVNEIYRTAAGELTAGQSAESSNDAQPVSDAQTGLFAPQAGRGDMLAAVLFRGDGYHLGVGRCCASTPTAVADATDSIRPFAAATLDTSTIRNFSPWRQLIPRYWLPTYSSGMHRNRPRIGAETSARDVIGRHAYAAALELPTDNTGIAGSAAYSYAGLGLPIIDAWVAQDWTLIGYVTDRTAERNILGEVRRRIQEGEVTTTWLRRRVRTSASLTVGAGAERRYYAGEPRAVLGLVDSTGLFNVAYYPRLIAALSWSAVQRPPYSISPEDGLTLAGTARNRWRVNRGSSSSMTLVGTSSAYKSLNLPGFAHHVIALRGAAGGTDTRSPDYLEVGGTSGTPVEVIAGLTVGEGRRTFAVRGFEPASLLGSRAFAGSAEYRAPLLRTNRGLGMLPFFFERSSLTLFADYGAAWCATAKPNGNICSTPVVVRDSLNFRRWIASAGAELNLEASVLSWDRPYRFRFGVARPVHDESLFTRARKYSFYFAAGSAF